MFIAIILIKDVSCFLCKELSCSSIWFLIVVYTVVYYPNKQKIAKSRLMYVNELLHLMNWSKPYQRLWCSDVIETLEEIATD